MMNVNLNPSTGRNLMSMMFGLKMAMNNLQVKIQAEQRAVIQATNTIIEQRPYYDMRYKDTRAFFENPLDAKRPPVIKQSQADKLESNTKLIYKSLGKINNYHQTLTQIKNAALFKGLRSNL